MLCIFRRRNGQCPYHGTILFDPEITGSTSKTLTLVARSSLLVSSGLCLACPRPPGVQPIPFEALWGNGATTSGQKLSPHSASQVSQQPSVPEKQQSDAPPSHPYKRRKKGGLPRGVSHTSSGGFRARIQYGSKTNRSHIGTFDTPEKASAAYTLVRDELNENRSLSATELDVVFEGAKACAAEVFQARSAKRNKRQAESTKRKNVRRLEQR